MIGRRAILKAFGMAPVAALASSAVSTGAAAQGLVGLGVGANAALGQTTAGLPTWYGIGGVKDILNYMTKNGLPEFYLDKLKEESDNVYKLDADLASNRSFSLATKIREQQARNFKRAIDETWARKKRNVISEQFKEKTGIDIW